MASSLSIPPSASLSSVVKTTATLPFLSLYKVSFRCSSRPNLRFFSKKNLMNQYSVEQVKDYCSTDNLLGIHWSRIFIEKFVPVAEKSAPLPS
ncbi:hypothetical protein Gohar_000996 [Gossypium harknessii]|uniref:Uncharacterized protein n=1 Tax=Gossypium harknessii TaxID=34285 RepID=A0A7J9I356_9ROSI|nr:hypothetical protein [Gossypium harknessii]